MFLLACSRVENEKKLSYKTSGRDWPIFRANPQLTGFVQEPLPDALKLLWSFKTGDEIKSSPVIAMERIFIGSSDGRVYALNLKTGEQVWQYNTGDAVEAAPLFIDTTLVVGSLNGLFFALDAIDGSMKWQFKTNNRICGSANSWNKVDKKFVFFGSYDNMLYCLNRKTGALVWSFETDNFINGAPAIDGNVIVVGGCDARLNLISVENGSRIGQVDIGSYIPSSPAVVDHMAYLGHYGNQVVCVDMKLLKIVWTYGDEENGEPFFFITCRRKRPCRHWWKG